MNKNKIFRFTTEITPETEVILNGRYGQPLNMRLDDGTSAKMVKLDTESIIRLQAFLSDYLQKEEVNTKLNRELWKQYLDFDFIDAWMKKGKPSEEERFKDNNILLVLFYCVMAQNLIEKTNEIE